MSIELEKVVEKFYQGLEEGKILGKNVRSAELLSFHRSMHAIRADAGIWNGLRSVERQSSTPSLCLRRSPQSRSTRHWASMLTEK